MLKANFVLAYFPNTEKNIEYVVSIIIHFIDTFCFSHEIELYNDLNLRIQNLSEQRPSVSINIEQTKHTQNYTYMQRPYSSGAITMIFVFFQ